MERRKCKSLSLANKIKVIKEVEAGVKKKIDNAAAFDIPSSTLSTIIKNKEAIKCATENLVYQPHRKRMKLCSNPNIEKHMLDWIRRARDENVPISGPIVREKTEKLASDLGHADFKASEGWLMNFKKRNGIVSKIISGESASVSDVNCEEYRLTILPSILEGYSESDIFNVYETGFYYKCLPDRTLAFKNDKCYGGKRSKDRITVMVGTNMTGT